MLDIMNWFMTNAWHFGPILGNHSKMQPVFSVNFPYISAFQDLNKAVTVRIQIMAL